MMISLTVDSVDVEGSVRSFPSLPDVRQHEVPAKHLPVLLLLLLLVLLVAHLLPFDLQRNVQGQRVVPEIDKPAWVETNLGSVRRCIRPTDRQTDLRLTMSSIMGLMSLSWLLLRTRVSSMDILLRPPGRVCSWFLCSHSVWTFSILQKKYIQGLGGCQGQRSEVRGPTCGCLQEAPPADCLPGPATPGLAAPAGPVEPL